MTHTNTTIDQATVDKAVVELTTTARLVADGEQRRLHQIGISMEEAPLELKRLGAKLIAYADQIDKCPAPAWWQLVVRINELVRFYCCIKAREQGRRLRWGYGSTGRR